MFSFEEARNFIYEVIQNIWQNGLINKINEVYTDNVVGHFQGKDFHLNDIKNRIENLNIHVSKRQFTVQDFIVIDHLIIFRMRQTWLSPTDKELCESNLTGVYRIKNKKISELWIMADQEMDSYADISNNIINNVNRFKVSKREKSAFLQQLTDYLFYRKENVKQLTTVEIECLYYYLNGYTSKEVAIAMDISHRTIENYINNIKQKYNCSTRGELRLVLFPNALNTDE